MARPPLELRLNEEEAAEESRRGDEGMSGRMLLRR